jgi:hypothetical protein
MHGGSIKMRQAARKLLSVSIALALVAIPFGITLKGWAPEISLQSASAKDANGKGGGNGNGMGKGGGKGKGGGNGNGAGKGGGNGKGEGGGNGKGGGSGKSGGGSKGGGTGAASSGGSAGRKAASAGGNHVNPSTGDMVQVTENKIDVLHRNGMQEGIRAGRYRMTDGKGRTIIERQATSADVARLRGMVD